MSRVVAIFGPTAVGKSELALRLAERCDGEILSADALQAYRGFDIGTAKPTAADRRRVPHHLIDILEPQERYSAGDFVRRALECIAEVRARGHLPLLVGGSGLYLRSLLRGISPIPPVDPQIRRRLRERWRRAGLGDLRRELEQRDPVTAARLQPGDSQRTLRALEVLHATARPLSAWLEENPAGVGGLEALRIGLTLPRPLLYDRIAERVQRMVLSGWVEEVRALLGRGLDPELPAFQAIGYRQLAAHVRGERTLEDAVEATVRESRRYAKRQLTWFRREPDTCWIAAGEPGSTWRDVVTFLRQRGLGGEYAQR